MSSAKKMVALFRRKSIEMPWKTFRSDLVFASPSVSVLRDKVGLPDGVQINCFIQSLFLMQ